MVHVRLQRSDVDAHPSGGAARVERARGVQQGVATGWRTERSRSLSPCSPGLPHAHHGSPGEATWGMRIPIVHHGRLPGGDQPVTGGPSGMAPRGGAPRRGPRSAHLSRTGHARRLLFSADLVRRAMALSPDRVIAVQPEDAPRCARSAHHCVSTCTRPDCWRPLRGTLAEEAHDLRDLAAGDVFSSATPATHGVAWSDGPAGVDVRTDPTRSCPWWHRRSRRHARSPLRVAGGRHGPGRTPARARRRPRRAGCARGRPHRLVRRRPDRRAGRGLDATGTPPSRSGRVGRSGHPASCVRAQRQRWTGCVPTRNGGFGFRHADYWAAAFRSSPTGHRSPTCSEMRAG